MNKLITCASNFEATNTGISLTFLRRKKKLALGKYLELLTKSSLSC
jgi:hypothetical protein